MPVSATPLRKQTPFELIDELAKQTPPLAWTRTRDPDSGLCRWTSNPRRHWSSGPIPGDYTIIKTNYGDFVANVAEQPDGNIVWIYHGCSFSEAARHCALHAQLTLDGIPFSRFRDENGLPIEHPFEDDVTVRQTDPVHDFVLLSRDSDIPWSLRTPTGTEILQAFLPGEAELFATAFSLAST